MLLLQYTRPHSTSEHPDLEEDILEQQRNRVLRQKRLQARVTGILRAALVGDLSQAERSLAKKPTGLLSLLS